MARTPKPEPIMGGDDSEKMESNSQGRALPESREAYDGVAPAVTDLPPANPFGEPVKPAEEYANISEAGKSAAALGIETEETKDVDGYIAGETIVEHPLSPTDANPNPHGQRSDPEANLVTETDEKGRATRKARDESDFVEVTGADDLTSPVHLGDGRTLAKGDTAKVDKDIAKMLRDRKQVK